jgi:hypothetical protein
MKATVIQITPEKAQAFLQLNTDNRQKRGWWIDSLVNMIKRGEWVTTHQGISFSKSGKLLDGQHRLEAIARAGIPVDMLVTTDVDDNAFKVLDNGIKRTLSDLTGMHVRTAEVCRVLAKLIYGDSIISADLCQTIYDSGVGKVHDDLIEFCGKNMAIYSSAPVRTAAVCLVMDGHDRDYIFKLYSNLCHQKFHDMPNIAHAFIRQVTEKRVNANRRSDVMARALKVFNPDFANVTRVQIGDSDASSALTYCRDVVRKHLKETK